MIAFQNALDAARELIVELDAGGHVPDEKMRNVYFGLASQMQSNCDAVASGLLATIGALCAHAEHLTREFLPSAMQPIYYLGLEDFDGVRAYILHVACSKCTYLDTQTEAGRRFLEQLGDNRPLIVESFRQMYHNVSNDRGIGDTSVDRIPTILTG